MRRRTPVFLLLPLVLACLMSISACGGGSGTITVTAINITPTAISVPLNTTTQFTAMITLSNTTDTSTTAATVTWYVNGIAGGNNTIGTIGASVLNAQVGVYTAPGIVPTSENVNGQVNITATTPQVPGSSTNSNLITSNTAIATVTSGQGLSINPSSASVAALGTFQFGAILNNLAITNAQWSISSANGGNIGSIDPTTGLYTAPPSPPPGNSITVTATNEGITATATATIQYSDHSMTGPFAFSYTGNDNSGFFAEAGSFQADGNGHIVTGVEDRNSFSTGAEAQVPILGTYTVGPDGRGTAKVTVGTGSGPGQGTVETWQFALTNFQHAVMTRFDNRSTGSGTIDQQNLNGLTTSLVALSGPYAFSLSGGDAEFFPQGVAGKFSANGAGVIPNTNAILDVNDSLNPAGHLVTSDRSLSGTYILDATFPGSGRGTITLTSATTGSVQFAFYVVDTTSIEQSTQLHIVEIDGKNFLAGDVFGAPTGNSFNNASLTAANYPFTDGGTSTAGAYAAGGVFVSDGAGNIASGEADTNNAETVTPDITLGSCTYAVDPTTGRIDLRLNFATGTCAAGPSTTTQEFAAYQTVQGSALMLELDSTAIATGAAFKQTVTPATAVGSFTVRLAGQGIFHNSASSVQQNVTGQLNLNNSITGGGTIDISGFSAVNAGDPVDPATTTIAAPDAIGRGTSLLAAMNPNVSYNLVYYVIDDNTALLFDSDTTRVLIGSINLQF